MPETPAIPIPEMVAAFPEVFLARLVLESELLATGRAAPTGIHLTLWGPDCVGLDAWTIARRWGWTDPELAVLRAEGEQFILVLQTPGIALAEARAELLVSLLVALRPDLCGGRTQEGFLRALQLTPAAAESAGLRGEQRAISSVFGVRDPLFGRGRIPPDGEPAAEHRLFVDAQLDRGAVNGLLPGTSAPVDEYAATPSLIRLEWP